MSKSTVDPKTVGKFWINSLGEFGHQDVNGADLTYGGCVNISEVLKDYPDMIESEAVKRAFEKQRYEVLLDAREHALWACFEALQSLESGTFRFYANLEWGKGAPVPGGANLYMTVEYILTDEERARLGKIVRDFPGKVHIEDMWVDHDDPTKAQYSVNFEVLGKSINKVAAIQIAWLDATADLFSNSMVNVL